MVIAQWATSLAPRRCISRVWPTPSTTKCTSRGVRSTSGWWSRIAVRSLRRCGSLYAASRCSARTATSLASPGRYLIGGIRRCGKMIRPPPSHYLKLPTRSSPPSLTCGVSVWTTLHRSGAACALGDRTLAQRCYGASLRAIAQQSYGATPLLLEGCARLVGTTMPDRAARWLGAAATLRDQIGDQQGGWLSRALVAARSIVPQRVHRGHRARCRYGATCLVPRPAVPAQMLRGTGMGYPHSLDAGAAQHDRCVAFNRQ